jgi:E3 ubiquitin-protein ligase RNF13
VRHAQRAGAAAAIIFDYVAESLVVMARPTDHPEPGIPSVFVSQAAGLLMKGLLAPDAPIVKVHISPVSH